MMIAKVIVDVAAYPVDRPFDFDHDVFLENLDELNRVAYKNTEEIKAYVAKFVKTYHPS